jgi:AbrB family looped-hinge helix DNA binding protein
MRITSRGQVTIPQWIRKQLGLLPDTEVTFEIDGSAIRIRKATRNAPQVTSILVDNGVPSCRIIIAHD